MPVQEVSTTIAAPLANPWLGLASYTESESAKFFGRERETAELLRLIDREALTVVFGRSGLGKTSLLRAGIIPQLRESSFFPIALRLDFSGQGLSPVEQLKAVVQDSAYQAGVEVANVPQTYGVTLWEFFHTAEFWSSRNDLLTPILLLDQFEEVFTIGRNFPAVGEFLGQLADLIENRVPHSVRERVERSGQPLAIDTGTRNYKVVLSLREDFVSRLDSLRSSMPAIMRNRFALNALSADRALAVIVRAGGDRVTEEVAQDIIVAVAGRTESSDTGDLSGNEEIEPAYLSVMCHELFRRMVAIGHDCITHDLVAQEHGGILEALYERSFEGLPPTTRTFVEERLLTASGYRSAVPVAEALVEGMTRADLETLVDRRLLRFEDRLGIAHVELSHDLLTSVVLRSRNARRLETEHAEEQKRTATVRRAFRRRVIVALGSAMAAIVVLGALTVWAVIEKHKADISSENALAEYREAAAAGQSLRRMDAQLREKAKELESEKNEAEAQTRLVEDKNKELFAAKHKTQDLANTAIESFRTQAEAGYDDALKVVDLYSNNLDENVKEQLNASLRVHRKNLIDARDASQKILQTEPHSNEANNLRLATLFALADLDSRAYGFDEKEYKEFADYAQLMLKEPDHWLQAKAIRMLVKAAGIMYRKDDPGAASALLAEARSNGSRLQTLLATDRDPMSAWDGLEDAYADCANLLKERNAKEARACFRLAVVAETNAAKLDGKNYNAVGGIEDVFGDFEVSEKDYSAAIGHYTQAIAAYRDPHNKLPDRSRMRVVEALFDRGDAERQAERFDAARKDYEESVALADKLGDDADSRFRRLISLERLGTLEMDTKHASHALQWFQKEKEIAVSLAKEDKQYHKALGIVFHKIAGAYEEMGDDKGQRGALEENAHTLEEWAKPNDEEGSRAFIDAEIDLGDFDAAHDNQEAATEAYDAAVRQLRQYAVRWPTSEHQELQWQAVMKSGNASLAAHKPEVALQTLLRGQRLAEALPAKNEGRNRMRGGSFITLGHFYNVQKKPEEALAQYRDARPIEAALLAENCQANIGDFSTTVDGTVRELIELKKAQEGRDEVRKALALVNDKCKDLAQKQQEDRADLAVFYGNMSYDSTMLGGVDDLALSSAEKGLSLDSSQTWIRVNLAHAYMFNGRLAEARELYVKIKNLEWNHHPLSKDIHSDFEELTSLGRSHPEMARILKTIEEGKK